MHGTARRATMHASPLCSSRPHSHWLRLGGLDSFRSCRSNASKGRDDDDGLAQAMTLIITLLTEATIYQSADHRLTNSDTGDLLSDAASKRVTLQYGDWDGLVSYTGVGRWDGRDTSDFVVEWLTGLSDAEPADVARVLQEEGARWIAAIKARTKLLRPHTFVLAFFLRGVPGVAFASNFEECSGRMRDAESSFIVSMSSFRGRPHVFVAGQKPAVPRASRRRLERLASRLEDEPQRPASVCSHESRGFRVFLLRGTLSARTHRYLRAG